MTLAASQPFLDCLDKSQLLTSEQMAEVREWSEVVPHRLADRLVNAAWITPWQARQLLEGNYRLSLGKYRLLRIIGDGSMGTVYLANTPESPVELAVKVVSKEAMATNPNAEARFDREAQALSRLRHPNIVAVLDEQTEADLHYLVMEYVPGRDLKYWLRRHPRMPVAWSCEVVRQAALGLQHAHEQGIVHRDVKPSNLLVVADDFQSPPVVKILDWGVVRLMGDDWNTRNLTYASQLLGTPDYMAPEQAYDPRIVDVRADIYALGCTLFRMLAGKVPFPGSTPVEKLMARAGKEAPKVAPLNPDVSPELDAVISKMMSHDPSRRYQTPIEAAEALSRFVHFPGDSTEPPPPPPPPPPAYTLPSATPLPAPRTGMSGRQLLLLGATAFVGALLGALAFLAVR